MGSWVGIWGDTWEEAGTASGFAGRTSLQGWKELKDKTKVKHKIKHSDMKRWMLSL